VNDKQIPITGATNGIGLAAEALAALGGNLAVVGRARQNPNCVSSHQGGGRERSDGGDIPRRPGLAGGLIRG